MNHSRFTPVKEMAGRVSMPDAFLSAGEYRPVIQSIFGTIFSSHRAPRGRFDIHGNENWSLRTGYSLEVGLAGLMNSLC